MFGDHDAGRCFVVDDELAAEIAEPDCLLAHGIVLQGSRVTGTAGGRVHGAAVHWNAMPTLPHRASAVKHVFDELLHVSG
jgi:hypothetical protein